MQKAVEPLRGVKLERRVGSGVQEGVVGSTAQQLRLRDTMLADLRSQNKALAGADEEPFVTPILIEPDTMPCAVRCPFCL